MFALNFENFECDCPYAEEDTCKHMVALGLKFIDLFCDFWKEKNGKFDKREFVNYLSGKKQPGSLESRNFDALSDVVDPIRKLKELFALEKNKPTKDLLKEAKEILNLHSTQRGWGELFGRQAKAKKNRQTNINDFYLDVSFFGNSIDVDICKKNSGNQAYNADYFLKKKKMLLPKQLELMKHLNQKKFWSDRLCPMKTLLLIKNSGMDYYQTSYGTKNRLEILDNQKLNLPAKLLDQSWFDEHHNKEALKFVFAVKEKDIHFDELILSEEGAVLNVGSKAEICRLPKFSVEILEKIKEMYYYFDRHKKKTLEVQLSEAEIININQVISQLKESFELKTELDTDFEIKQHKRAVAKIVVDYDCDAQFLEIKAVLDYGLEKQNVGESVYSTRSRRGRKKAKFRRREVFPWQEYIIKRQGKLIEWAKIRKEKEIKLFRVFYDNLEKTGFSKRLKFSCKGDVAIADFYDCHWSVISKLCRKNSIKIEFEKDRLEIEEADFRADFKVDLNADNDWLAFDVDCYCGQGKITIDVLQEYIVSGRRFVKKNGKLFHLKNREELEKLVLMLESFHQRENQKFEGRVYHAPELEDVIGSKYYNAKISKSFQRFVKEAQSGRPVEKVKVPAGIGEVLRGYQKEGLDWCYFLRKYRFGGILADDMGLGKTLQALSLIEMNKIKDKPSLVVCPKTLLFNWEDEATKFFPQMKTLSVQGTPKERQEMTKEMKKYDLVIASYPTVKQDEEFYAKANFNYCFLDEAQFIKNGKTKNAKAVKKINADYRLALTGTPLENSVSEVWSIFDFLMPGFLGRRKDFFKRFEKPIMKQSDAVVMKTLQKKIACFMLRRTKEKVLKELPAKIEQSSHCRLADSQNVLYQEILSSVRKEIFETVKTKGFSRSQIHILAGLTKLRQVCNHPVLLLKDKKHEKYESAKLELFCQITDEIIASGRKALVFSQFTQMLDILAKELEKKGVAYHYLSGRTRNRKELVQDFNENPEKRIFLISLKAGGTGLNLVSADNVIIFDPWWNPSVENQAIDRAHRIGQKKTVNVYRLLTKGTIEEKIVALQEKKRFLFDNLVGESKDMFKKLTWEDVKELFRA